MNTSRWLTVLCLAASMPAYASSGFKPIELKDSEMAELRGRYVMPGRIISFGLVMSSTFQNAAGDIIKGTANLQIDSSTITPQFYVHTSGSAGTGPSPNTGAGSVVGGAGLGTGTGVTQSVRTAGDGNTAYNNVGINVTENGFAPSNIVQSGQALVGGGTVTGDSAAGRVSVSANNGGLQMAIQGNNNQGNSLQQIGGGQVQQATVLTGDRNFVTNMTQLNVVMNNGLNNPALNCNLDQLKALRTLGY